MTEKQQGPNAYVPFVGARSAITANENLPPVVTDAIINGYKKLRAKYLARRADAHAASQEPPPKHPGGTTEIHYSDLTQEVAREVDRIMRQPGDSHDHT